MVDLEPDPILEVMTGDRKDLFDFNNLIYCLDGGIGNSMRGRYTIGKEVLDQTCRRVRKMVEACDSFQGFMIYGSLMGATSGFIELLSERLAKDHKKASFFNFLTMPSPNLKEDIVSTYNTVLNFPIELDNCVNTFYDNEALYNLCEKRLGIAKPDLKDINRLMAHAICPILDAVSGTSTMNEIMSNLIVYKRITHLTNSFAPFSDKPQQPSVEDLILAA